MLALQRLAGNRAVGHALATPRLLSDQERPAGGITLRLDGITHPVATTLDRPDVRFRMPTFADLKSVYTDKAIKIPESVVQERVGQLLGRMAREKRLKSKDSVATILSKIFPSAGVIDEAEFKKAVDVADRTVIYQSVLDADTKVKKKDKAKLKTAMADAIALIKKAEADSAGLTAVFGSKDSVAKGHYARARKVLATVSKDMDTHVSTDYNLDDPEVFLGGWASHGAQHIHLLSKVVTVTDPAETKATLIHEAAHLADGSIDDHGYYSSPGFEALDEKTKIANAAHYEELPRRLMGTSSFPKHTFAPGKKKGGGVLTLEDEVRRTASEYLRKAWDAAVDTHTWLRGVRKAGLAGSTAPFTAERALILEVSKLMDLTIHEQAPAKAHVTALDVTLTESIARGVGIVGRLARKEALPPASSPIEKTMLRLLGPGLLITKAAQTYGHLLGDDSRDMGLLDWLVDHYRKLP